MLRQSISTEYYTDSPLSPQLDSLGGKCSCRTRGYLSALFSPPLPIFLGWWNFFHEDLTFGHYGKDRVETKISFLYFRENLC
jgi:hypothetical protein